MASFDENGKYIKTNWKAGDKISSTKLNKIEESIEAVNDNDISRHVEADARLDALEAKDVAHDKELTKIKNDIADNKAAAELGDYDINSRMTFLENELNEGIEEVHNVAGSVDGKITTAEANMTNAINTAKDEMTSQVNSAMNAINTAKDEMNTQVINAMNVMNTAKNEMTTQVNMATTEMNTQVNNAKTEMNTQINKAKSSMTTQVNTAKNEMAAQVNAAQAEMTIQVNLAKDDMRTQVDTAQANMTDQVNSAKSEVTSQVNSAMNSMNTAQTSMQAMVEHIETEIFTFENRIEDEWDGLHENVANYVDVESNSFTLGIHEDGLLYIFKDGSPKGVGIKMLSQEVIAGDVIGFIDDDNNIVLSGALAEGIYTLKYEMDDGTILNVGEIRNVSSGPSYINQLPISIDKNGQPYNGGQGWKTGYRISLSSGGESEQSGCECTGFIPVPNYDAEIRLKNIGTYATDGGNEGHYGIVGYDKNFNKLAGNGAQLTTMTANVSADGVVTLQRLGWATHFANTELAYVRISSTRIDNTSIITVNEKIVSLYTNQIPLSINSDGTLYNGGQGWKTGYRISKSGGGESAADGYECTGFIPVTKDSIIRIKGIDITATDESAVLCGYDKNFTKLNTGNGVILGALIKSTDGNGVSTFKGFGAFTHFSSSELAYIRLSSVHIDKDSIITVDEPII